MKEITLTQGKVALVDDEDYEFLNQWKWYAWQRKDMNTYYAIRNSSYLNGKRKTIKMHRFVLGIEQHEKTKIDHIDRCGGNNQKHNLRAVTHSQNMLNRVSNKNATSKYKGVYLKREIINNKWAAQIKFGFKRKHLGYFKTQEDAAKAYNEAAKIIHGEFACLNII